VRGNSSILPQPFVFILHARDLFYLKEDISTMATSITVGQRLEGKLGSYLISSQVAKDIWTAT